MLDEWLFSGGIDWHGKDEEARREIVRPLRRIRHERQPSAHSIIKNEFDIKYVKLKREVLEDAAFALGNILHILLTHPCSPEVRLPKWFEEGRIEAI